MNALTTLVAQYLKSNNISRNQLAKLIGYSNTNKGLRTIDNYLETLQDHRNIASKIRQVLNIPAYQFENAVYDVMSKIELKARSKFKPSIHIIPSSRRTCIFCDPRSLNVQLPDISNCSLEQELRIVFNAFKSHQLKYCSKIYSGSNYENFIQILEQMDKKNKPYYWTVGNGCRYMRTYSESIYFNRHGEITDHIKSHI